MAISRGGRLPFVNNVKLFVLSLLIIAISINCWAEDLAKVPMVYVLPAPDSEIDHRDDYVIDLLKACLERTRGGYGDYTLIRKEVPMSMLRRIKTLEDGTGEITVTTFPDQISFDKKILPVRIPIDFGLAGYRVLLIKSDNQAKFYKVQSLSDLRNISIGLGQSWVDSIIIGDAGVRVVSGSSYDGLFQMLAEGRFDGLNRSIRDAQAEHRSYHESFPTLAVEESLLLHYALPDYFWFSNDKNGKYLAKRVSEGLAKMKEDGTMQVIFKKKFCPTITSLNLKQRTLIEIPNKLLDAESLNEEIPIQEIISWCE